MLRHPGYTRERIAQVGDRIRALIHADAVAPERLAVAGPVDRIEPAEAELLDYRDCELGETFGPLWASYWFKVEATVPERWQGERVDLLWVSHSEATLWDGGRALQGLNTSPDGARVDAMLREAAAAGERLDLRVELACNGLFGELPRPYASREPVVLDRCQIARFDPRAWRLHHDFDVLRRLEAEHADGLDPTWAGELLYELNRVCNVWSEHDPATWDEAEAILAPLLERRNATVTHELSAIGHAHLDTAWLWPLAESYRKAVRSFSSQVAYMDRYPEFRFACSQAQQYDWIRRRNPELYGRIRARVESGQWLPVGGTWVEPDCNLPSGESLVRQFLHGQRYFEREFGRRCPEFWNPDVFGYNGQLPQIMRGAGIGRFLTQKLSWNRFNPPDHHTFTWQGIDGSQVLAHFPPADTYNATAEVAELRRSVRDYRDHDRSHRSLLVFGYGDGGGGPTPDMLETLRRARDLQGLPRTTITTSDEFFTALEADARDLPAILGELYFEYHRGTYTSQAAVKLGNARGERALHDAEFLAAVAMREAGAAYPAERLDELWKLLLLNQFHDILPGSSIGLVYEDAARDHAAVLAGAEAVAAGALAAIAGSGPTAPVNTLGAARAEVAERPDGQLAWVEAPSYGVGTAADTGPDVARATEQGDGVVLENGLLRAELTRDGRLVSLVHRAADREALDGAGERLPAVRRPAHGLRGLGHRPVPPRDGPGRRAGRVLRRHPAERTAGAGGAALPVRDGQHAAPAGAAGRGRLPARVPLRGRLAGAPDDAEGAVPGGRAQRIRHLPDAVRPRRAAHPLLHQPRPRPLRGARAPLRRPVRARLRRGAPDRLQVRLLDAGRRDADQPAALDVRARPRRRRGQPPVRLRGDAARGRLARGGRGGRGGPVRDAAAVGRGRGWAAVMAVGR